MAPQPCWLAATAGSTTREVCRKQIRGALFPSPSRRRNARNGISYGAGSTGSVAVRWLPDCGSAPIRCAWRWKKFSQIWSCGPWPPSSSRKHHSWAAAFRTPHPSGGTWTQWLNSTGTSSASTGQAAETGQAVGTVPKFRCTPATPWSHHLKLSLLTCSASTGGGSSRTSTPDCRRHSCLRTGPGPKVRPCSAG